jgi:acetolactate synthase I/II/III large subunit
VHIGPDPLYARYPMRGFRTDIALAGLTAPTVTRLAERALGYAPAAARLKSRFDAFSLRFDAERRAARGGAPAMSAKYATACVNKLLDEETIVVNEYPVVLEEMNVRKPGRYYASSPSSGL